MAKTGDVASDDRSLMENLAKNDLEGMYHALIKNNVTEDSMWCLTKNQLDQFRVPYQLLKRYLQTIEKQGKFFLPLAILSGCSKVRSPNFNIPTYFLNMFFL